MTDLRSMRYLLVVVCVYVALHVVRVQADVQGVAMSLACMFSAETHDNGGDADAGGRASVKEEDNVDAVTVSRRRSLLTSLVNYGCYCDIGRINGEVVTRFCALNDKMTSVSAL